MFASPQVNRLAAVLILLCVFALNPTAVLSQSSTAGLVSGVVTDQSKGSVAGASVTLAQKGTSSTLSAISGSDGRYVFSNVEPGNYTLRVTAKGFRSSVVEALTVDVQQSYTINITLEVGQAADVVEVTAAPEAELQTTDASIGTVLGGEGMARLPALTRSASSLMFYQVGVTPSPTTPITTAPSDTTGGQVSGSRSEQITFNLDGGDATSDLEGSNSYISPPGEPLPAPIVPVPAESTEEFRVNTSNPNATLGRSSGGQVALITKHGTNSIHGSAYEYHGDDGEAANSWTNNIFGLNKPHQVDNRFGFTAGGPIWKDKLFIFGNFEGRRFNDSAGFNVLVPTASLKAGQLRFVDAAGTTDTYNLNPANGALSSQCGATGTSACDPRGIGVSPVTMAQLALYPTGNNTGLGDGLNTTGYAFNIPTPVSENIVVTRIDYKFNPKWSLFGTYHWAKIDRVGTEQIEFAPTPKSVSSDPFEPGLFTLELTGQLTSNLTMVTHGSYLRNWWGWDRLPPTPLVTGTTQALELAGEGLGQNNGLAKMLADPININTQQARGRLWDGHNWYIAQDYSWVHGKHVLQFGLAGYIWNDYHLRTDDVLGGLSSGPILYLESTSNLAVGGNATTLNIGGAFEPLSCGGAVTANCLNAGNGDPIRWDQMYSVLLGLVDRSAQIETRNGQFQANPLGTPLQDNVHMPSAYSYFQDIFQVRPGLTITAGVNWGVQLSPSEAGGKEVLLGINGSTTPINFQTFLQQRAAAMSQGQVLDPQFDLIPTNAVTGPLKGSIRATDWKDFGPRISAAWTVPWHNKLFGDKATVIRGGYGLVFDRTSAVSEVLLPLLSGGLADVDQCAGPTTTKPGAGPGAFASCTGATTSPINAFRIGVDGSTVPLPAPTGLSVPFTPGSGFPLFLSAPLDPYLTPAHIHNFDFTIQRALPGKMFLEIGYIGRLSRNLPEGISLNTPYYLAKSGGQTLAQAFDAVAQELRAGKPVTPQPFFENFGQSTPGSGCTAAETSQGVSFPSCTQFLAASNSSSFINGDLGGMMQTFDLNMANPMDSTQVLLSAAVSDRGFSNYHAGFVSLNKSFSNNLQMQANWTWSHAIGDQGLNQQNDYSANSPFNYNIDKSSELFDRRHAVNLWWYYTLPFGKGKYANSHGFVNRIIGGWYTSGIYTFATGLPIYISADGNYGACCGLGSSFTGSGTAAVSSLNLQAQEGYTPNGPGGFPNLFRNEATVFGSLSRPLLSVVTQQAFDELRLRPIWNVDFSVGKNIIATEHYKLLFSADFFNLLNHPELGTTSEYGNISLDMASPGTFGQISAQDNAPRKILFGLRFEF